MKNIYTCLDAETACRVSIGRWWFGFIIHSYDRVHEMRLVRIFYGRKHLCLVFGERENA